MRFPLPQRMGDETVVRGSAVWHWHTPATIPGGWRCAGSHSPGVQRCSMELANLKEVFMARPSFTPTPEQRRSVKLMAGLGLRQEDIALIVEIAPRTLRKHFRKELDRGMAEANAKVLQTLFGMATSGKNTPATIFWSKTRCGLRERREADEHSAMAPPTVLVQIEEQKK